MLIELWEKIRGYDKWIRTEAKLGQSEFERTAYRRKGQRLYAYRFEQCLEWVDQLGQSRSARFRVPDGSPLFPRSDGDRVVIRYDPANPENYYFPNLLRLRIRSGHTMARGLALYGIGACLIVLLLDKLLSAH